MRRVSTITSLSLCALLFASVSLAQQTSTVATAATVSVPNLIRYSATLKDAQGAALPSATTGVTFSIYKQQDGGAPVWMETQNVTTTPTAITMCCWEARPQPACPAICSRSRSNAGWVCRCRDKQSRRA